MRTIFVTLTDAQAKKLDALKELVWECALVKLSDAAYIPLLIEGHYTAVVELEDREEGRNANLEHQH